MFSKYKTHLLEKFHYKNNHNILWKTILWSKISTAINRVKFWHNKPLKKTSNLKTARVLRRKINKNLKQKLKGQTDIKRRSHLLLLSRLSILCSNFFYKLTILLNNRQQRPTWQKLTDFTNNSPTILESSPSKNYYSLPKKIQQIFFHSFNNKQTKIIQIPTIIKKTNPQPKDHKKLSDHLLLIIKILFWPIINPIGRLLSMLTLVGLLLLVVYLLKDLPSPRKLTSLENYPVSTQIFDRNGILLYEIFGNEHRIPISINNLPDYVLQATIAIEDKNFYSHHGFDIQGILRALTNNLQGNNVEGGSTITQQLVKNALLSPERSLKRKLKEFVLSIMTELIYSKEEILEMYLNYISYGGVAVGIESASWQYFNKSASELTLAEASLLAGLPQAPSYYSPFGINAKHSLERQAEVLRRMREDNYITALQAQQAKSEPLNFALSKTDILAPHFVFYVRDLLYQKYGEKTVKAGGLRVTTTLDLPLQNSIQASLSGEVEKLAKLRVGNGAALVIKPNTGEILAMIGSKDYFNATDEGQVNVTLANRQPGSSIKPLVYATAFEKKLLNPGSVLLDIPTCFKIVGQKDYCPKNYNGGFSGPVTVRHALGNSLNIPAVKTIWIIGVTNFINQAKQMGITTWNNPANYGPALALGGGEVKMIDMAQAFATLANQGVRVPLSPFLKIENYKGKIIYQLDPEKRINNLLEMNLNEKIRQKDQLIRVMHRAPAYLVAHIMQDNNARLQSFGSKSKLVIPGQIVSVKTGTTNDLKDNWTIGFTPEFLVAVWVGNNNSSPMSRVASGVTGATPIWNDIMSLILANKPAVWQEKPPDINLGNVCINGFPPERNQDCLNKKQELYWLASQPSQSNYKKTELWIRPETGLPPQPGESTDGLVLQEKLIITDPFTNNYCADCQRPTNENGQFIYEKQIVVPEQ